MSFSCLNKHFRVGDHLALHYEQVVDENVLGEILWGFSVVKCFEDLI